jgi:putative membrane protein insertion efficiency factor
MSRLVTATPRGTSDEATPEPPPFRGVVGVMTKSIRAYQLARSGRPSGCRYLPSCSEYAIEAIGTHGAYRGSALAVRRLTRCTPWGGHGVDPVPDRRTPCTHP